jgi:hypothetical protein
MTITIHWWYFPIILFLLPIVYYSFKDIDGGYFGGGYIAPMFITFMCWIFAIGLLIGHFF